MSRILRQLKKHDKDICIYGLGKMGACMFWSFRECGMQEDYYADKDPNKQNLNIDGIKCISFDDLLKKDRSIILIVALYDYKSVVKSFVTMGFKNVYNYKEVLHAIRKEPKRNYKQIRSYEEAYKVKQVVKEWLCRGAKLNINDLLEG